MSDVWEERLDGTMAMESLASYFACTASLPHSTVNLE